HMYGRSYRTYPIERIIADLDDIYYNKKTRLIFITDDNMLLNPRWVEELCDAIIRRKYRNLQLVVQADCVSMARNEQVVQKMARAGFRAVFLGIESVSERNLQEMDKSEIIAKAKQAVANCHRHGMMVMGGLIFGMPDDNEESIRRNYQFLNELEADASYCQMLSPFPKTVIREHLIEEGLVTNLDNYERYNGMWANVRTKHLDTEQLQYAFWLHRQITLGWWDPSEFARNNGKSWTAVWTHVVKPVMKYFVDKGTRRDGWEGRYRRYIRRLEKMNYFPDLEQYYYRK
ncbi:MAG: radical SAM protein, partial [Syntrophaceae bacterium]